MVDFNSVDSANSWHLKRHLGMRQGDRNWAVGYIEDLNSNPMPIHGENLRLKRKKYETFLGNFSTVCFLPWGPSSSLTKVL